MTIRNNYLNYVNRLIGENARVARQFYAQPQEEMNQSSSSSSSASNTPNAAATSTGTDDNQSLSSMFMLIQMLMQMMNKLMPSSTGSGEGSIGMNGLDGRGSSPSLASYGSYGQGEASRSNGAMQALRQLLSTSDAQDTTDSSETPDISTLLDGLQNQQFSQSQLSGAVRQWLAQGPTDSLPQLSGVMSELMSQGKLDPRSLLRNEDLTQLSSQRQDALQSAIAQANLWQSSDAKPNGQWVGFLVQELSQSKSSPRQEFLQQAVQSYADQHLSTEAADSPANQLLFMVMQLSNTGLSEDGRLTFPNQNTV